MDEWRVGLSIKAFSIFIIGFTTIFLSSTVFDSFFNKRRLTSQDVSFDSSTNINQMQMGVWLAFQIIVAYFVSHYLKSEFSLHSLIDSIGEFRDANFSRHEGLKLPVLIRIPRSMCVYSGYYFVYLLGRNFSTNTKKNNRLLIANAAVSMFSACIIGGSRGELFRYGTVGVVSFIFYSFLRKKKISIKTKVIGISLGVIFFTTLFFAGFTLLGRGDISRKNDFLFWYLSGSIANFEYYLKRADFFQEDRSGTFVNLDRFLVKIGRKEIIKEESVGRQILYDYYNVFNGHSTGNVYTMFASYYHDGRVLGIIVFSALLVVLGECLLYLSFLSEQNSTVNIYIILYGFLFFDCTQAFFSNRFFSDMFSENYLKFFLFLIVFSHLFILRRPNSNPEVNVSNELLQQGSQE